MWSIFFFIFVDSLVKLNRILFLKVCLVDIIIRVNFDKKRKIRDFKTSNLVPVFVVTVGIDLDGSLGNSLFIPLLERQLH